MVINTGERQHRITFQRKVVAVNELNEPVGTSWVDEVSVWAKLTNQLSPTAEAVASGATAYREQVRFDIEPRPINPDWRITYKGKAFDIKSIATSNDNSETAIIAVSGLNNG